MAAREEGPWNVFSIFRKTIQIGDYPLWVKEGVSCIYCVGFWCSLLWGTLCLFSALHFIVYIGGVIGGTFLVTLYFYGMEGEQSYEAEG
jgi:hypothetical protein